MGRRIKKEPLALEIWVMFHPEQWQESKTGLGPDIEVGHTPGSPRRLLGS